MHRQRRINPVPSILFLARQGEVKGFSQVETVPHETVLGWTENVSVFNVIVNVESLSHSHVQELHVVASGHLASSILTGLIDGRMHS